MTRHHVLLLPIVRLATLMLLAGCGGGGGGGSDTPPVNPPANRAPVVANGVPDKTVVSKHSVDIDATQGGTTFSDPDNDPLTYQITTLHSEGNTNAPGLPSGLRVEGTHIVGASDDGGIAFIHIEASDNHGHTTPLEFQISIERNHDPHIVLVPPDMIVTAGQALDFDAAMNGATFLDQDLDPLTYQVTFRGASGLTANGRRVKGSLSGVSAVEVTVTANDPYGGSLSDAFLVAVAAPEPGAPSLPTTPYAYTDQSLPLISAYKVLSYLGGESDNATTEAGAALGRLLFYDKRLSITNTLSCGSCHQQAHGFASPNRFDTGVLGITLTRNTMGLTNVRFTRAQAWFWDMRSYFSLRGAAREEIESANIMGQQLDAAAEKLRATSLYPPLFQAAFGNDRIDEDRILRALGQYLQSLISYRTRYDDACMSTDDTPKPCGAPFTAQELRGYQMFMGTFGSPGFGCASLCHDSQTLNNDWQADIGLDLAYTDPGITVQPFRRGFQGAFHAASLRNLAHTPPYMHDGRFTTLREVINHFDHGIQNSPNLDFQLRDGSVPKQMNLTEAQKDDLEAFLNTLTDDAMAHDPKFSDPFP